MVNCLKGQQTVNSFGHFSQVTTTAKRFHYVTTCTGDHNFVRVAILQTQCMLYTKY